MRLEIRGLLERIYLGQGIRLGHAEVHDLPTECDRKSCAVAQTQVESELILSRCKLLL